MLKKYHICWKERGGIKYGKEKQSIWSNRNQGNNEQL